MRYPILGGSRTKKNYVLSNLETYKRAKPRHSEELLEDYGEKFIAALGRRLE